MRICNKKCKILPFVEKDKTCPILSLPKPRKSEDWYFYIKKKEKFSPLCEDNDHKTSLDNLEIF